MKKSTQTPKARQRRLNIRLSQQEWDKVNKLASNTTCRSVSDYARKVLSEKPVKVFYRNQSFDEFDEKMTRILPQFESFGEHLTLLVKKISSMESTAAIRAIMSLILDCGRDFTRNAEEIKKHIEKLSDQCDPK